jgi:hypothetical protein
MVELVTTEIITVSSVVLFGYWLRCAWLLLRPQYPPPNAAKAERERAAGFSVSVRSK